VTGRLPKEDSVLPFDSVLIFFPRMMPVLLSKKILPVDLLFIVVVVSPPIISALVTVTELEAKSTTIVESFISAIA
jgi:hypothetical protein